MKLLKSILLAIDFSKSSENVLKNSVKFAKKFQSKITLIHILPDDLGNENVKLLLNKAVIAQLEDLNGRIKNEGVAVGQPILEHGNYCDKIIFASENINANLIIVGSGHKSKDDAFQLGTTAERIIRKSNKPIFVIKNNQSLDIQNIICPVDFSKESGCALNNAIIIARLFNANLVILSVYSLFKQPFAKLEAAKINEQRKIDHTKEFNKFLKAFNLMDVNAKNEIRGGDPALEILRAIKSYKSDLLIMGTTGKSGISKILMGSVTEKVIRQVLCSFITLKNEEAITLELESKIQDIENHYATAQELFEKGFYEASIQQFNICLGINYTHIPSLKGMAKVYEKLGDVNNAKKYQEMVKDVIDQIWNLKIEEEARKQTKK